MNHLIPKYVLLKSLTTQIVPASYDPVNILDLLLHLKDVRFNTQKLVVENGYVDLNGTTNLSNITYKGKIKDNQVVLTVKKEVKKTLALWGLYRSLIANMIEGVEKGYEKQLELHGVGHKVVQTGKDLTLHLGFSHPVIIDAPDGISFEVQKSDITVSGISKELVGKIADIIRAVRPPEPYKGKGIRYKDEYVRRKAGKAGKVA